MKDLVPAFLPEVPVARTGVHPDSSEIETYGGEICTGSEIPGQTVDPSKLKDTGRWAFVSDPKASCAGFSFIDCTHPDDQGSPWHQF